MKEVQAYQSKDGTVTTDKDECATRDRAHEAYLALLSAKAMVSNIDARGDSPTQQEIEIMMAAIRGNIYRRVVA
jgi:hypothetical protein